MNGKEEIFRMFVESKPDQNDRFQIDRKQIILLLNTNFRACSLNRQGDQ